MHSDLKRLQVIKGMVKVMLRQRIASHALIVMFRSLTRFILFSSFVKRRINNMHCPTRFKVIKAGIKNLCSVRKILKGAAKGNEIITAFFKNTAVQYIGIEPLQFAVI